MKIDLVNSRAYSGLGDVVSWAWVNAACKVAGQHLTFYRTHDTPLLEMLGMERDDDPEGAINPEAGYWRELVEQGRDLRLDYMRDAVGIVKQTEIETAPPVNLLAAHTDFAAEIIDKRSAAGRLVLLCPQTNFVTREWPAAYWHDLGEAFQRQGYAVAYAVAAKDARFDVPYTYVGLGFERLAALMKVSRLVVGNDSFPVHLAATVGTPTLAITGPTNQGCAFGHYADVLELIQNNNVPCTGCHFGGKLYRHACEVGCASLLQLTPVPVFMHAMKMLR